MFRQFGVDPTKTRPSSEALLRRIRRGESLPRIDAVVDIGNWCSLETQLPYGLYDLDRIQGAVDLRLGAEGEEYAGIRKDVVHVAGRLLVADAVGPFGNPTSDSARTSVSSATRRVLVVIYAPATLPASVIDAAVVLTSERLKRYLGAEAVERVR
jgi:DNA/RNA-binding domain of Phe-tRNA-synthetase-like protein